MNASARFLELAQLYAVAADTGRAELLDAAITDDVLVEGPGFTLAGRAQVSGIPAMLKQRFRVTRHVIENQHVTVEGSRARGETWCTAYHLHGPGPSGNTVLVWRIRYQDEFTLADGTWRFSRRRVVLDWTETRAVDAPS